MPSVQAAVAKLTSKGNLEAGQLEAICAEAATAASNVLYDLSGRIYTGNCGPVRVRPVARPADGDARWSSIANLSGVGYSATWGVCTGVRSHYGCSNPPEIDLGVYPVTEILSVKIDGVTIPEAEYELRDYRTLVRLRPTASSTPTERYGWPTCQVGDLPDTQPGTFSVTYKYGQPPPASGVLAARKLAEFLARPQLGDNTGYPQRVTSFQRQGVSAMVVDVMDVLKAKASGIYEVDLFLLSVNPNKNQRQAAVWSPDLGRPRRTATTT